LTTVPVMRCRPAQPGHLFDVDMESCPPGRSHVATNKTFGVKGFFSRPDPGPFMSPTHPVEEGRTESPAMRRSVQALVPQV